MQASSSRGTFARSVQLRFHHSPALLCTKWNSWSTIMPTRLASCSWDSFGLVAEPQCELTLAIQSTSRGSPSTLWGRSVQEVSLASHFSEFEALLLGFFRRMCRVLFGSHYRVVLPLSDTTVLLGSSWGGESRCQPSREPTGSQHGCGAQGPAYPTLHRRFIRMLVQVVLICFIGFEVGVFWVGYAQCLVGRSSPRPSFLVFSKYF